MIAIGNNIPTIALRSAGSDPYKSFWYSAAEGAKSAGATIENLSGSCLMFRGSIIYNSVPPKPSLLIVPQFYKEGNLYQDVPPFVAEDTTMRFTVTRATTAWRVNSSGLIESVASGVPRIDWQGQSCPALLVEPAATNLVLQSRDLSVSGTWSASGITAVRNAIGADGTASGACTLTATAASATITQNISHASQSRIFSAVMRRVTGTGAIELTTNGGTNWTAVTLTTAFTQLACAAQTVASGQVGIRMIASGDVIEVDFTQGEVGPVATSPIATTSGSITRNADQISASGALVSGLIGQTEGVLYCEFTLSSISDVIVVPNAYNSAQNYVGILHNGTNSLVLRIRYRSGGSNLNINFTQVATIGTTYKVAIGYKSGDSAAFVNGVQVGSTDTTAFAFENPLTLIETLVRQFYSSALFGPNRIRSIALYTTRLSNAQLAELTRL